MKSVLIVDDEKHTRDGLTAVLSDTYDVFAAANADEAINMLDAEHFDAVVTDLRMAGKSGLSVIDKTFAMKSKPVCIMLTAYGNMETAVEAMKRGATDFITKPVDIDKLENSLKIALEKRDNMLADSKEQKSKIAKSVQKSQKTIDIGNSGVGFFIASSPKMQEVLKKAKQVANSKATVMITGQTGTGKELIASLIHNNSPRADKSFVPVHCAALPANLLESELFGYEKGAFTGANQRRIGRFEVADSGTIFLDEIGEIDEQTQVKLLRFLETKSFERLGSTENINVNVRIVCATNKNLKQMCENGQYREDLYYRLNVVEIKLPSLREHKEDIIPLINSYIEYYCQENDKPLLKISDDALDVLENYSWHGNIRELRNFCENIVVMSSSDIINVDDLDSKFTQSVESEEDTEFQTKKDSEIELIKKALIATKGNKSKAALMLGISRRTLHRKLEKSE